MRNGIPVALILVLTLTLVLGVGVYAQVKKDSKSGLDRLEGTIQSLDKAKSSLSIIQSGPNTKPTWHVVYNDKTTFTARNKAGKVDDLKEGQRIIVLGKFADNVMTATRIDMR